MRRDSVAVAIAGLIVATGAARAGTVVQSGMLAPATTNWASNFQINAFDDHGGALTLESVTIDVVAMINVNARIENRDRSAHNFTLNMDTNVSIMFGATPLLSAIPAMTRNYSAQAFDGIIDFGGSSGATFASLLQDASSTTTLSAPTDDLGAWIGAGPIILTALANAHTSVTGGGNLMSQFNTDAGIDYYITYSYRGEVDPNGAVPLPSAAALGLAGLCGVAGLHRRRR